MYLYYDRNLVLREVINDEAIAQTSSVSKIYIYFEKMSDTGAVFSSATVRFKGEAIDDYVETIPTNISNVVKNMDGTWPQNAFIPFDENRDLKFFKYTEGYPFIVVNMSATNLANVTANRGSVVATPVITISGASPYTLSEFTFYVENSTIQPDEMITIPQFYYLVELLSNITVDSGPVYGSVNPVSSGGVYNALQLKQNKLTAGNHITIVGATISADLTGYATETWVENQHYLTAAILDDYATKQWVENKGYITGVSWDDVTNKPTDLVFESDISDMATQTWVSNQGFLTSSDLSGYATETYVGNAIASAITNVYRYKGSVSTYADLPSTGLTAGDVYNVESTGDNYAWTGTAWDKLAGTVDLSSYATQQWVSDYYLAKSGGTVTGIVYFKDYGWSVANTISDGKETYSSPLGITVKTNSITTTYEAGKITNDNKALTLPTSAGTLATEDYVKANPTVPSGTTPTALSNIKVGSNYYEVSAGTNVVANPTLAGTESALTGLQVGNTKYKVDAGIDSDVLVEIETTASDDYASRTNYATAISLQNFIANCEAGNVYTEGTIARISNLIGRTTFRLLLIGTNHEVLAYNDTTYAKTTWQFLDMPQHNVSLGLPFNLIDWATGSGKQYLNEYLNGINENNMTLYPSNMGGLITAQGLLQVCHTIFESLPTLLKEHIKTVRRYYYRKRNYMNVGANGGSETNTTQMCQLACNVFHLAGTDLGTSGKSGEGSASKYTYFNTNASARRIRFYNGSAADWWTASPRTSDVRNWCCVDYDGNGNYGTTDYYYGVAPAFCI